VSKLPQLSLRVHGGMAPSECVARARHAETLGFLSLWFAENAYERGVLPAATACALATERILIGIGVFNPYNRHPTLMAMEIGALDEMSNGRAILGIGFGIQALKKIGPHERPLSAVRDATEIVRPLLAGKEVSYRGKMFSAEQVSLGFKPLRHDVPIYLAAMADQSLKLCGKLGDGLIIGNMCPPDHTRHAVAMLREGAKAVGREPPRHVVKYVPCSVHADARHARDAIKPELGAMLSRYWKSYENVAAVKSTLGDRNNIDPEYLKSTLQRLAAGELATRVVDDAFVAAYTVSGTPDQCAEQCAALGEQDLTELTVSPIGEDPDGQLTRLAAALPRG
jgi:5,10-methylenetetrahydromethanopterin reductase